MDAPVQECPGGAGVSAPRAVPFTMVGLDHVVLRTANMDRLRAFYELLGCTVVRDALDSLGLLQLRLGASILDLLDVHGPLAARANDQFPPDTAARNLDHFAVRIEPFDEAAIVAFCEGHSIPCQLPGQPLLGAEGIGPAIYITDPDGNRLELKGPADQPV